MKIPLTKGQHMLIDPEDLHLLDGWRVRYHAGYAFATFENLQAPVARLILGLDKGDERKADHINPAKTLDNRRKNLRIVDKCQSQWNTRKKTTNKSGYKGVSWHSRKQKWQSSIIVRGENKYLGEFTRLKDAVTAYRDAAKLYHGEYARF